MEDLINQKPVSESISMSNHYSSAEWRAGPGGVSGYIIRVDVPGATSFQFNQSAGNPVITFCNNPSKFCASGQYMGYVILSKYSPINYESRIISGVLVVRFPDCHGSLKIHRHPYLSGPPGVPLVRGITSQDQLNISALLAKLESSNALIKDDIRDVKLELARELSRDHLCKVSSEIKGEGKSGAVYSAVDEHGVPLAVKRILLNKGRIDHDMVREMCLLIQMDHPNIVRLYYVFPGLGCINLAMESCDDDICGLISQKPSALNPTVVKDIMHQILTGVAFLHEKNIIHRDLNPKNILYCQDSNLVVKLADFGLARMIGDQLTPQVTSLLYRAPEVLLGSRSYTAAIDLWSVGCIFGELLELSPLFCPTVGVGFGERDVIKAIFRKLGCPVDSDCSKVVSNHTTDVSQFKEVCFMNSKLDKDGKDLLSRLLCLNPAKRIGAAKALEHPYFLSKRT